MNQVEFWQPMYLPMSVNSKWLMFHENPTMCSRNHHRQVQLYCHTWVEQRSLVQQEIAWCLKSWMTLRSNVKV